MYSAEFFDPLGNPLGQLGEVLEVQAARSANSIGKASIRLGRSSVGPGTWRRDMRVKIYRSLPGGKSYLLGNTVWFARKFSWNATTDTWLLNEMHDTLGLLNRRLVAYPEETLQADKILDNGNEDEIDNLMRAYVRENMGSLATDTTRDLSAYFTVEADQSLASLGEKTAAWAELFSTLNDLINDAASLGTKLYMEVVPMAQEKFQFRVFKDKLGVDRTGTVPALIFGPEYKNLSEVGLTWDYSTELTYAYVGGDGEAEGRLIETVSDATRMAKSVFNRWETFVDGRDELDSTVLQTLGRVELRKATPKLILEGQVLDTPAVQFGRDYFYGDMVKAAVKGFTFSCLIDAFSVTYGEGREELQVRLRGETDL